MDSTQHNSADLVTGSLEQFVKQGRNRGAGASDTAWSYAALQPARGWPACRVAHTRLLLSVLSISPPPFAVGGAATNYARPHKPHPPTTTLQRELPLLPRPPLIASLHFTPPPSPNTHIRTRPVPPPPSAGTFRAACLERHAHMHAPCKSSP